jgi:hypothetical protein
MVNAQPTTKNAKYLVIALFRSLALHFYFGPGGDRGPHSSNPVVTRGGFKVCRAAGNSNVFQAPVVHTFQVPPVCELPLDIAPAQATVGLNRHIPEVPVEAFHGNSPSLVPPV